MLNSPYGGKLVNREEFGKKERYIEEARESPVIFPYIDFFYDSFKISDGSYSPLEGFMDRNTLETVLNETRLPSGLPWSIPVILAVKSDEIRGVKEGDRVILGAHDRNPFGFIDIDEIYKVEKEKIASKIYGTTDPVHPNVEDLELRYGDTALGGKVTIFERLPMPGGSYELSPAETRARFESLGWKNVVAYQARNPPHVAHEYLQKVSLEVPGIDGLFIHLVVGKLKKGDYKASVILDSYRALIDNYHRRERVLMGALSITMRYAGPKAALFLATIRRNYGATHYIIGRDQAGVGNFYGPYDAHKMFDEFNIGITPLKYTDTFYCRKCQGITSEKVCPHDKSSRIMISQTKIREMLSKGEPIPGEIIRKEVAEILSKGNVIAD